MKVGFMEFREFIAVRRAFCLAKREMPPTRRLIFEELSLLCHMHVLGVSLSTSTLAAYQNILRPTMTHRSNHLVYLGYVKRFSGQHDHRTVCLELTDDGNAARMAALKDMSAEMKSGNVLTRVMPERLSYYVDAMGVNTYLSKDLIMMVLATGAYDFMSISKIASTLGSLQPTVSMSVSKLEKQGYVKRNLKCRRSYSSISLTSEGMKQAQQLLEKVGEIIVRRNRG